jgi:hypothetical protein
VRPLISILISLFGFVQNAALPRVPGPLPTQAALPSSVRDPEALAAVQSAISTMGGAAVIGTIQSSVAQGTSVVSGSAPGSATSFTWSHSGRDFRYENDAITGSHVFVSNNGSPCDIDGTAIVPSSTSAARSTLPFHIPAVVLYNELNNPNYSITFVGATPLNGIPALHIQTADNSDSAGQLVTPQDWYFNATTGLPLSVQYRIPDSGSAQNWQPGSISFANFQTTDGVLVPFQLTIQEGPPTAPIVATIGSLVFNTTIASTACIASTTVGSAQ